MLDLIERRISPAIGTIYLAVREYKKKKKRHNLFGEHRPGGERLLAILTVYWPVGSRP